MVIEKKSCLSAADKLRSNAEEQLQENTMRRLPRSDEATLRLVHELQVHQIELERQNAELRQAREDLETAQNDLEVKVRKRTVDLSRANEQITHEINERRKAEESLICSYEEIKRLKTLLQAENIYLQQELAMQHNFGEIIGHSKTLSSVFVRIQQVAPMTSWTQPQHTSRADAQIRHRPEITSPET